MSRTGILFAALLTLLAPAAARSESAAPPRIEWRACPWPQAAAAAERCGDLVVPQRRNAAGGATIRMFFAVYARTGAEPALPDPIVIVPGGPGALFNPPVAYVMAGLAALRKRRDVVIVDQRGVGRSVPRLACDEGERRMRALDCLDTLRRRGIDPAAFDTEATAQDLRDLRIALRLAAWNPVGASYGSRVVLRLMQIDPEGTRAVVSLASLPLAPSLARPENPLFRRGLIARLFADCAAEPACAAAYGDLAAKFAAIQRMLAQPNGADRAPEAKELRHYLAALDRRRRGFASALIRQLDWSERLPVLPRAVADLHDFLAGTKLISRTRIDAIYGLDMRHDQPPIDRSLIFYTTRCPEDVLPPRGEGERGRRGACGFFNPAPLADTPLARPAPLLILTGAYDIRTLTGWSDEIAAKVPGAIVARMGDAGHDVSYRHPCGNALMTAFVTDPRATLDLACVANHRRPKFQVPDPAQ
ncbi:MAG: alpha/beta fold hydrolase [Rhodospirillaceae bacterium]|nr:alpha/beta fold hydrolase [Rhodospirillaceae bacterium]